MEAPFFDFQIGSYKKSLSIKNWNNAMDSMYRNDSYSLLYFLDSTGSWLLTVSPDHMMLCHN